MSMQNTFLYFLSMLVESIALSCCILAVFRDQKDLRKRDFILVPSVSLCLLIARSSYGGGISRFSSHAGLFPGSGRQFPNPADSADGAFIADQHSVEYAGWRAHILWYNGRLFSLFVMPLLCSYLYDLF